MDVGGPPRSVSSLLAEPLCLLSSADARYLQSALSSCLRAIGSLRLRSWIPQPLRRCREKTRLNAHACLLTPAHDWSPLQSSRPLPWPVRLSRHPPQHLLFSSGWGSIGRSLSGQTSCSVAGTPQFRPGNTRSLRWAERKKETVSDRPDATRTTAAIVFGFVFHAKTFACRAWTSTADRCFIR